MKDFMSRYMRTHQNDDERTIDGFRREFVATLTAVHENLGPRPFHLYAGFNSSAFDAVFTSFARNIAAIPTDVGQRYRQLAISRSFEDLVRGGTTDVDQVQARQRMAQARLFT